MPQNGTYAPPRLLPNIKGGAYIAVFCDVCDEGFQARRPSKTGGRTHATKRHVCATPGCYRISRVAHTSRLFAMCAMRGSKHAALLKPEAAHMPQDGMYAPPTDAEPT